MYYQHLTVGGHLLDALIQTNRLSVKSHRYPTLNQDLITDYGSSQW